MAELLIGEIKEQRIHWQILLLHVFIIHTEKWRSHSREQTGINMQHLQDI